MTVTPTRTPTGPRRPLPDGAEALIREARRFQRRRWARRGALLLAVVVVLVAAVAISSTQGPPPAAPRPAPFRPGPAPTAHVVGGPSLGPATSFVLTGPTSVATDAADDAFFTDGNRLYEVDHATGQLLVVAGTGVAGFSGDGGPATAAQLDGPSDVALAPDGDVYFVDGGNRIRQVSAATGIITDVAGTGVAGEGGDGGPAIRAPLDLSDPDGGSGGIGGQIAVGPNGDLYIADTANNVVQKISAATGTITAVAGNGLSGATGDGAPATKAGLCSPVGVTVDRSSDLFIATGCDSVREVSARTGLISTVFRTSAVPSLAGEGTVDDPVHLGLAANGDVLLAGAASRRVLEIDPATDRVLLLAGTGVQTLWVPGASAGDGGPAATATFGSVSGLAVGAGGDIYVADFFDNAIRAIDPATGLISLVAGQIPTSPAAGHCC